MINDFNNNRTKLSDHYVRNCQKESVVARYDELSKQVLELAQSMEGQPHCVIKAKCFSYILENANIYINPDDWFGIALESIKVSSIWDVGINYYLPMNELSRKWQREMDAVLNLPEDKHFAKYAEAHLLNEFYMDYNHSTPCWEDIFALGLNGLRERAREYKQRFVPLTSEQEAYFEGIEISYTAVINLLKRYAQALKDYNEPKMVAMRKAIEHLIDCPPSNIYEAMLLGWIYWYVQECVDGIRVRTMGGLDRLYRAFYEKDIKDNRYTRDEVCELFTYFMNSFHALRVVYQQPMYVGGVDEDGNCVVNELSYVVMEAYNILCAPNPKLQVIISRNTPDDFLKKVLEIIREGNSSISIINHEIAEASLLKIGATQAEARTYLMSGCWDYAIRNHEVKTVPVRVSLPKILEYTMNDGVCLSTGERVGMQVGNADTFDDFYAKFEQQWLYIQKRTMGIIENWEQYLAEVSPANMYSGTMTDSLSKAVDGYAKGMKYNQTVYTVCGLATLVDSLCAIKKYVFDKKEISMEKFIEAIKANWKGYEELRRKIQNDSDKYGNGSDMADELMVKLTQFFADNTNGKPNSRGGIWKIGILSIDKNVRFGKLMCATPDGRGAGEPLSKNLSPVIGMDRGGLTTLLNSLNKIDFSNFAHSAMLDLILHPTAVSGEDGLEAFSAIVRTYFNRGGHSLQFNVFSSESLIAAQKDPDKYRNLQVRVCGWNVYFVDLEKTIQDAFIEQCKHQESIQ